MGGNERNLKREKEREKRTNQSMLPCQQPMCGARVAHVGRGLPGRVAHGLHTWPPSLAFGQCLLLSRSARVLRPYPGLRTPILNPSLDYEL
jgi:hypothetical protein